MIDLSCDYNDGAHPSVLEALIETNMEKLPGYGADVHTERAADLIRKACGLPAARVFFLSGGTQTNAIVISAMLKSYEGAVCAATGHISLHEAGAIELTGHEVLPLPETEGKITASALEKFLRDARADGNRDHMVFPGLVYISFPTEYGTLYTKKELTALHNVCRSFDIPLFIDGARLGYGLGSEACDLGLPELARLCEVFYIGGTKAGALCGEAVVFTQDNMPAHFMTMVKQRGGLLAKGRLMGVQFETLFESDLYFNICSHADAMAMKMKRGLRALGIPLRINSPTNQQFPVFEDSILPELEGKLAWSFWEKPDETHTVARLACNWATRPEDIDGLLDLLREALNK